MDDLDGVGGGGPTITVAGFAGNLLPVILGNIIGGNAELVAEVTAPAHEIFVDVDTPEAYQQLLAGAAP